jgi:hypothetical protein
MTAACHRAPRDAGRVTRTKRDNEVVVVRRIFWPVAWLVLLIIVAVIIGYSTSYVSCIHEQKQLFAYQYLHAGVDVLNEILQQRLLRLKLQGACASKFAEDNEHAIGALSAFALAIFTFYLWRATRGLRHYAEIQARDMRQLVRLARANALAGIRAARAARTSANAAMRQMALWMFQGGVGCSPRKIFSPSVN